MANAPKPSAFAGDISKGARLWSVGDGTYRAVREAVERLPAALYEVAYDNGGLFLKRRVLETDVLVDLHDAVTDSIVAEIEDFWELERRFAELGLIHKRGVLMHGPAGTGKTAVALRIAQRACERNDAIAIMIENANLASQALAILRRIEPHRKVVALLEDIDELLEENDETEFLSLLDGEKQIGNVVFVATTNHFKALPERIGDRPSCFDIVRVVGPLTPDARKSFLVTKDPGTPEPVLAEMVRRSEGYTIAHLKELLVLVRAYGMPVAQAAARLDEMMSFNREEKET